MPRNRAKSGLLLLGFPPGLPELLCGLHGDAADLAVQGRPLISEKSPTRSPNNERTLKLKAPNASPANRTFPNVQRALEYLDGRPQENPRGGLRVIWTWFCLAATWAFPDTDPENYAEVFTPI